MAKYRPRSKDPLYISSVRKLLEVNGNYICLEIGAGTIVSSIRWKVNKYIMNALYNIMSIRYLSILQIA